MTYHDKTVTNDCIAFFSLVSVQRLFNAIIPAFIAVLRSAKQCKMLHVSLNQKPSVYLTRNQNDMRVTLVIKIISYLLNIQSIFIHIDKIRLSISKAKYHLGRSFQLREAKK